MPADDFKFLSGHFRIHHRRLRERFADCTEWIDLEAEFWGYPVMDGAAAVDEMKGEINGRPFWGMTVRMYDPETNQWALYWADSWTPHIYPPVKGTITDGVGEFRGSDTEAGRAVEVRFRWSITETGRPLWDQSFSLDGGESWEMNWTMEFEKLPDSDQAHPPRPW